MTEVSKMTDQQLNRALAELMGWKNIREDSWGGFWGQPSDDRWCNSLPAYCYDHAASLEVQAVAYKLNPELYLHMLAMQTNNEDLTIEEFPGPFEVYGVELVGPMVTANPRQRAEAAYMTLREVIKA